MVLTLLATLGSGEHYLTDLFTAFPYALLMQAIATRGPVKQFYVVAGAAMTFAWMALLRWRVLVLIDYPALLWMLTALTVVAAVWCERRMWQRGIAWADRPSTAPWPAKAWRWRRVAVLEPSADNG